MIASFHDDDTAALAAGFRVRRLQAIELPARTRLARLDAAATLQDLRQIPGNRLEALSGDRQGQYSIPINDQWRIFFRWLDEQPHDVEIVDYH